MKLWLIQEISRDSLRPLESWIGLNRSFNNSMFWGREDKLKYFRVLFRLKRRSIRRIQRLKCIQVQRKFLRFKIVVSFLLKIKVSTIKQFLNIIY